MAQTESQPDRTKKPSSLNAIPNEFAAMGQKRFDEFMSLQTEILEKIQQANRQWVDRAQAEANMASEFASRLTSARSLPEAMTAYQEWTTRRFAMMVEDGKHLLADTQKFMQTGARFMSSNWGTKGGGVAA